MFDKIMSILGGNLFQGLSQLIESLVTNPNEKAQLQATLQQKELEFKIALLKYEADDVQSARNREVGVKDKVPMILSIGITLGFFSVLGWMLIKGIPQAGGEALLVMLGSLGTAWAAVVGYYFGGSLGSDTKTQLLGTLMKGNNKP